MGNYCPRCNAPSKETDVFCGKCGMKLSDPSVAAASAAPNAAPVRRRPAKETPLRRAANLVMGYVHFLLIGMVIFTLVLGILNLTAGYEVKVSTVAKLSAETQRDTQSVAISEIYKTKEFAGFTIASMIYGVFNFVLAGFGGYGVFLRFRGYRKMRKLVKNYSLTGLAGNIVYLLLVWILGVQKEEYAGILLKASVLPPFTLWLSLILFVILLAAAMCSRNKRRRR